LNPKKVLLVDDDVDVLEPNQFLLIDEGYDVITAKNGAEAIDAYIENKPDIVLMDIKMPVLDGYEAFYKIMKIDKNAKIVFTSAYAIDNEKYQKAKQLGICDLLAKPFDIDSLVKSIIKYSK